MWCGHFTKNTSYIHKITCGVVTSQRTHPTSTRSHVVWSLHKEHILHPQDHMWCGHFTKNTSSRTRLSSRESDMSSSLHDEFACFAATAIETSPDVLLCCLVALVSLAVPLCRLSTSSTMSSSDVTLSSLCQHYNTVIIMKCPPPPPPRVHNGSVYKMASYYLIKIFNFG